MVTEINVVGWMVDKEEAEDDRVGWLGRYQRHEKR